LRVRGGNGPIIQGLKKVLSGRLVQLDFPARQATSHSHLPDGQGIRQVISSLQTTVGHQTIVR